ncbi:DUF3278 domain-containing protein [Streptococcus oricebi]|uniref:DUF3278 domain-containing protein n=1 Tax=Streptococcus oricebi TaxID=1547447 RepID=A0ABS5B3Y0_9STRE|nr:hypothetical protein [Streptococcus oricebi]
MNKETLIEKMIKRFYGVSGQLDEYRRSELDKIGNQLFIFLTYFLLFGNLCALVLASKYPKFVGQNYPLLLEVVLLAFFAYILYRTKKKELLEINPEEMTAKELKKYKYAASKAALFFGLGFHILMSGFLAWMQKGDFWGQVLDGRLILASFLGGLFFGVCIKISLKLRQYKGKGD